MTAHHLKPTADAWSVRADRFEIIRLLGEGGMGVVHEAFDRSTGRRVALKTLRDLDTDSRLRFKREFRALQGVTHSHLVRLHELFEADGRLFFSMDLVEGKDFLEFVRPSRGEAPSRPSDVIADALTREVSVASQHSFSQPSFSQPSASQPSTSQPSTSPSKGRADDPPRPLEDIPKLRRVLAQLVRAVDALHGYRLIHRDIKPSNMLVDAHEMLRLLDFGLVTGDSVERSKSRHFVGTAAYMAPEQVLGEASFETDWYSVGVVLFQALTGVLPFDGSALFMITNKVSQEPPRASSLVPGIPDDLDALCSQLLRRDPRERLADRALLDAVHGYSGGPLVPSPPSPPPALPDFVGRNAELAWLLERYERMANGNNVVASVVGESGIGKSTLVRSFLRSLDQQAGVVVLSGRCYERESIHYKGIDGIVDSLVAFLRELPTEDVALFLPRRVSELIRQFPAFAVLAPFSRAAQALDTADMQQARAHGILALRELLLRLRDRYRVVAYIDDLQWIDADGANVLQESMCGADAPKVLLITTTATTAEASPARAGSSPPPPDTLVLGPLTGGDSRALVDDYAARQRRSLAPQERESLVAEAEGNPILLFELLRHALGTTLAPASTPSNYKLNDVIGQRVAALPAAARRLLELVCVAEMQLSRPLALRALELDPAALSDAVEQLAAQRFVVTVGGSQGDTLLLPSHDRVRRAVLSALGGEDLRALHRTLALALEQAGIADPEALAMDWSRAGEPTRAAPYAEGAGRAAAAAFAFDRACALFRLALAGAPEAARRRELYILLGEALANAGRGLESALAFASAVELTAVAGEKADLKRRLADQLLKSGHIDDGIEAMRAVLAPLGGSIAETPRRALLSLLYHRGRLAVRGLRHTPVHESAVAPEVLHRVDVYWAVSNGLSLVDTMRGVDFQTRCLIMALDAGEPARISRCLAVEAVVAASEGKRGRTRTPVLLDEAERLAHVSGQRDVRAWLLLSRGIVRLLQGRFQACLDASLEAERILLEECQGAFSQLAKTRSFGIWSLAYLGRLRELERRTEPLLRDYRERGDLTGQLALLSGPGHVAGLARDEVPAMRRDCEQVLSKWSQRGFHFQHLSALFTFAVGDLYEGHFARASQRVEDSWQKIEDSFLLRNEFVRADSWYLRGRAALATALIARKPPSASLAIVQRAIRTIENDGAAWASGFARVLRAGVAQLEGQRAQALTQLGLAEQAFLGADMRLHAASCGLQAALERGQSAQGSLGWLQEEGVRAPLRFANALAPTRRASSELAASGASEHFRER